MKIRRFSAVRRSTRTAALILALVLIFSAFAGSASAWEVKGQTLAEALHMDGAIYYQWLSSHENDYYYNTTPYAHADHRNPNGDCQGANGDLDEPGVPAMNCMGFVWHALYMPTRMSGGYTGLIPAYGNGGWYGLYYGYDLTRRYFSSKKALLDSGYAEAGDIIWMFVVSENVSDDSNHIAIYMGDGHSDRVWHAVKKGCCFGSINPDYEQYLVIKSGVVRKVDAPVLQSVVNADYGPKITWKKVKGATRYKVFVKDGTGWKGLGITQSTSFVDKTAQTGNQYTYTVRCCDANGKYISGYDKKGKTILYYAAPGNFRSVSTAEGVKVEWDAVENATAYRVYRKTADTEYQVVKRTAATSFLDTNIEPGKQYFYTVRTLDGNYATRSGYRAPIKAYYLAGKPVISGDFVNNAGLNLTWNKVNGAEYYGVYKMSNGNWTKIGVTDTNSFVYQKPGKPSDSLYTVRCLSSTGNALVSDFDEAGYRASFRAAPKIDKVQADSKGVKILWSEQTKVSRFRVYRKDPGAAWKKIGDTEGLSFIDTKAVPGTSYRYTLRALNDEGTKLISGFDSQGAYLNYAATPKVTAKATANGIQVKWSKSANATYYRVFVLKDGSWRTLKTTKATEFLFTDVKHGEAYTFTVRCVDTPTKWFNSYCDRKGATATYIDPKAPAVAATEAPTAAELAPIGDQPSEAIMTEPETAQPTEAPTEAPTEEPTAQESTLTVTEE